jgi:hypothetical protein
MMLVFRSAITVCVIALLGQQALADNVGGGSVAESVEAGNYMAGTTSPAARAPGNGFVQANAASCSKAPTTPEQKALRQASKGLKMHAPKTPEQKAQAAARHAANCGTVLPT